MNLPGLSRSGARPYCVPRTISAFSSIAWPLILREHRRWRLSRGRFEPSLLWRSVRTNSPLRAFSTEKRFSALSCLLYVTFPRSTQLSSRLLGSMLHLSVHRRMFRAGSKPAFATKFRAPASPSIVTSVWETGSWFGSGLTEMSFKSPLGEFSTRPTRALHPRSLRT